MGAARMLLLLLWLGLISRISGQESELSERCGEEEYNDTRSKYEACASNKIREITDRLATDKDSVCVAVQQLIHNCGDELGWCFTEEQVAETKRKQKAGLEGILSERYEGSSLDECFNRAMPVISSLVTTKPTAKHVVPTEVTTPTAHLVSTANIVKTSTAKTTSARSSLISSTPELQTTRTATETTHPATETTRPATETTHPATETTRTATETHRQTTPITTANTATADSYDSHKDTETGGPQETMVSKTITPQKSQEIQTNSPKQTTEQIKTQTTKLPQKVSSVENKSHNYPTKNVSILLSTSNVRAKVAQEASKFPNNIPKEASDIRTNIPQEASEIQTNIPQEAMETRSNVLKPSSVPVRQPRQNVAPSPNNNAIISRCPEIINAILVIYIYLFIA